jgi:hypothetical protein
VRAQSDEKIARAGNPIFQWALVGFWAGNLGIWSKELTHREFFEIYGSKEFSLKVDLV